MRLVVVLFAQARELPVPRTAGAEAQELYAQNYGLDGLWRWFEDMHRQGRTESWPHRTWAWRRILALFTLIYSGSDAPQLPMTA